MDRFLIEMRKWPIKNLALALIGGEQMAKERGESEVGKEIAAVHAQVLNEKCSLLFRINGGSPIPTDHYFEMCKNPANLEDLKFAYDFMLKKCNIPSGNRAPE